MRAISPLELHHQEPGLGGEECAVPLALGEHEPGHFGPVGDLPIEVLRLEGGVSDAAWLDHGSLRRGMSGKSLALAPLISRVRRPAPHATLSPDAPQSLAKPAGFGETS